MILCLLTSLIESPNSPYGYKPNVTMNAILAIAVTSTTIYGAYLLGRTKSWFFIVFIIGAICKIFCGRGINLTLLTSHKLKPRDILLARFLQVIGTTTVLLLSNFLQ